MGVEGQGRFVQDAAARWGSSCIDSKGYAEMTDMYRGASMIKRAKIYLLMVIVLIGGVGLTTLTMESADSRLIVHYLDVGQADAIFIQAPTGQSVLIDAGERSNAPFIIDYLKQHGVTKLDHVVGTHPHSDHIGGLADVIKVYEVGAIYLPRVVHTTKTYENLLLTIKDKGLKVKEAKAGTPMDVGEGITAAFIGPVGTGYKSLNDYSAVLMLTFGDTAFLFMADAEQLSERQILAAGYNVNADVLKVGHHGSDTSSSTSFLEAVEPTYVVISVGQGNRYGHPATTTLQKLASRQITILRTDLHGTIVIISDGQTVEVITEVQEAA